MLRRSDMDGTLFQYCPKIVLFNEQEDAVLLAKRKGEADFDGIYSFIGGKMEVKDEGILGGLRREKNEEIGTNAQVDIYTCASFTEYYVKKSGQAMVLPHHYAVFRGGNIELNDEYSAYKWVNLSELASFEPKIATIAPMVEKILKLKQIINSELFERI